jgi:hypothetical protein
LSTTTTPTTPADLADEASAWAVGGGILTVALFPLALPIVLLTAAAALPLLLIPMALGLLVAAVALPVLLVRGLWRWASRALRPDGIASSITTTPRSST